MAGVALVVLQWLAFSFSVIFTLGIYSVLRREGGTSPKSAGGGSAEIPLPPPPPPPLHRQDLFNNHLRIEGLSVPGKKRTGKNGSPFHGPGSRDTSCTPNLRGQNLRWKEGTSSLLGQRSFQVLQCRQQEIYTIKVPKYIKSGHAFTARRLP